MSKTVQYFLHSTSLISFHIDVILTLSINGCYQEIVYIFIFLVNIWHTEANPTQILPPYVTKHMKPIYMAILNKCRSWQCFHEDIKDATVWRNPWQVSQIINVLCSWSNAAYAFHIEGKHNFSLWLFILKHTLCCFSCTLGKNSHLFDWT